MNKPIGNRKTVVWGYLAVAAVILSVFLACMGVSLKAKAGAEAIRREKTVSAVCVKEGDTLWSIAADFYTEEYKDVNALIYEIEECNGISDHIHIGQNIIVPHYR